MTQVFYWAFITFPKPVLCQKAFCWTSWPIKVSVKRKKSGIRRRAIEIASIFKIHLGWEKVISCSKFLKTNFSKITLKIPTNIYWTNTIKRIPKHAFKILWTILNINLEITCSICFHNRKNNKRTGRIGRFIY